VVVEDSEATLVEAITSLVDDPFKSKVALAKGSPVVSYKIPVMEVTA
jgi:hypothetical protein